MILHGDLTVGMNTEIGHCGGKYGRQQLELLDVDFGKLLSGSYPYHLRFVSIHLQSDAAHPGFDASNRPQHANSLANAHCANALTEPLPRLHPALALSPTSPLKLGGFATSA